MPLHKKIRDIATYFHLYKIHFWVWAIFIVYEVLVTAILNDGFGTLPNYIIHYFINISLFYLHSTVVMPWVFKRKESAYWLMVLSIGIQASAYVLVVYNLDLYLIRNTNILGELTLESADLLTRVIWRGIYFLLFGTGYYFFTAYLSTRKVKEEMQKEKLKDRLQREKMAKDLMIAKNTYLKAQINPHFLFNTLDFIYHDIAAKSPNSGDAVLGLADIMRFALDVEHYGEYIQVGKELIQLEKFIEVRRLTNKGGTLIELSYHDEVKTIKIIPLVILTLAENMIKHGDLKQTAGTIHVFKINDKLHIVTKNRVGNEQQTTGFGSGLSNIEERLSGTYHDRAALRFMTEGAYFKVEVTIPIDE